jgi:acetyl-CoA C-acetyltransferase
MDDNTPVLVGVGQVIQKGVDPAEAHGPTALAAEAARRAALDAGVGAALLSAVDRLLYVRAVSVDADDPPRALADVLGMQPRTVHLSGIGGNTPQMLANQAAEAIAKGEAGTVLIAGVEALDSIARAQKAGIVIGHRVGHLSSEERDGTNKAEMAHGLYYPVNAYPLFENALRAEAGWTLDEHLRRLGALFAPFTDVAATNPYAWFPVRRTGQEIATPGPKNRFVGFPYTKLMNAIMQVDQAAALIMTSVANARRLGVPRDKWVFLHGCADTKELWYLVDRVDYCSSPAIRVMGREALGMAHIGIDDVAFFDLYSCFPSAVQVATRELGIAVGDPRHLTVTGGLPYAGGPGNNYVSHSIAAMAERLRARPESFGLVTANGWYLTKHSAGVWSTAEPKRPFRRKDPALYQAEIDALPHPNFVEAPHGRALIETYTVVHGRDGAPRNGIVIGRLQSGGRFVAHTPEDRIVVEGLMRGEAIGRLGHVVVGDDRNLFTPD